MFFQLRFSSSRTPSKFLPHFKWDEVGKRPRCECLTLVCLTVSGVIGERGRYRNFSKSAKGECFCMSNLHTDEANKVDPIVVFFHK